MPKTTRIRNAAWIVAWDATTASHFYLNGGDLVFSGDTITHVGKTWPGEADETIDGADLMVMPGLVDIHSHPSTEPFFRGVREEHGLPSMYMSGLYERSFVFRPDEAGRQAGKQVAYCEMLLTGITTVADLSGNDPGWIDLAARSGLRVFLAPGYASARWHLENDWDLRYAWDDIDRPPRVRRCAGADRSGDPSIPRAGCPASSARRRSTPAPKTCCATRSRRRRSVDLPFTTHCAQSVNEFHEMVKRHGKTPVQWAKQIGILGPRTILGHAIFIDEHSWLHWHSREDLGLLADSGTSVAHCPSPFARYGHGMEDFGRYRRAGVNIGIGTDVAPHNLIEEMRLAAIVARILAEDIKTTTTAEVFRAATAGGAAALGRDDIGRLAPGAKADLVLVDLKNPFMMPARDPLRSLIYTAADRAIRDVYIAGTQVVRNGKVLTLDHAAALEALAEAQQRMLSGARQRDYKGRTADEVIPLSLPTLNPP